jgi:hypothetical protein
LGEVCAAFTPLNLFDDPDLQGRSPMLVLSVSHYCKLDPTGKQVVDATQSRIGEYLGPVRLEADHETRPEKKFACMVWSVVLDRWRGRASIPPQNREWLKRPAVQPLTLGKPQFAEKVAAVASRPFEPFLAASAIATRGRETKHAVLVAPYHPNPESWDGLQWRFYAACEPLAFGKRPDSERWRWRLHTWEGLVDEILNMHPRLARDEHGPPCERSTRGPLYRIAIRRGPLFLTGKGAAYGGFYRSG